MLAAGVSDVATSLVVVLLVVFVWVPASRRFAAVLRSDDPPRPDFSTAAWPGSFVAVVMAVYVGLVAVLATVANAAGVKLEEVGAVTVQGIVNVVACVFAVRFARRSFGVRAEAFGLRRPLDRRAATFALSSYLTFIPAMIAAVIACSWLYGVFGRAPRPQEALQILGHVRGVGPFAWLAVLMVIVIPITEEILFRGLLYSTLRRRFGRGLAIVATSVAFALLHDTSVMLPVFAVGVCLAIVFDRTQSVVASSFAHMIHNGAQVLFLALARR